MGRICRSLSSCFEVVPEATSAWKPEQAPQATVTKSSGKSVFEPPPAAGRVKPEKASIWMVG